MTRLAGVLTLAALLTACAPATLADKVSDLRSEVRSLEKANADLDTRVKSLERVVDSIEGQLAVAKRESAKQDERMGAVEKTTRTLAGQLAEVCSGVGDYAAYYDAVAFHNPLSNTVMFIKPSANFPAVVANALCD